VEAHRTQNGLTQCHNCQQFGHVWANCKQSPRCLWCGRGHLHMDCTEKEIENSSPSCCNSKLKDGERPHPSTYRGCSHVKEDGYSPPVTSSRDNPSRLRSAVSLSSHLSCSRPSKASLHLWTGRTHSLPRSPTHKNQVSQSRLRL
jgi:hypothetical protein